MNRRIFAVALSLGVAALLAPRLAFAEDHLAEAISHTKEAIDHGGMGHADVLVTHAEAALEHAQAAEKAKANPHTWKGLPILRRRSPRARRKMPLLRWPRQRGFDASRSRHEINADAKRPAVTSTVGAFLCTARPSRLARLIARFVELRRRSALGRRDDARANSCEELQAGSVASLIAPPIISVRKTKSDHEARRTAVQERRGLEQIGGSLSVSKVAGRVRIKPSNLAIMSSRVIAEAPSHHEA